MNKITFRGTRRPPPAEQKRDGPYTQVRVIGNGVEHDLPLRLDVCNHSPDGFEWGYGGSGPAQLALAMLLELGIDERRAALRHQRVKELLLVRLPLDEWEIEGDDVMRALERVERNAR